MASRKESSFIGRLFSRKKVEEEETRDYRAVTVRIGDEPCQAVLETSGKRYLSAEAPFLPLKDCDRQEQCSCRYQHYKDRRKGPRRGEEIGMPGKKDAEQAERRMVPGRRAEDTIVEEEPISVHEGSYFQHAEDTTRTATLEVPQVEDQGGVDPYNSGSFDKSKAWKKTSGR